MNAEAKLVRGLILAALKDRVKMLQTRRATALKALLISPLDPILTDRYDLCEALTGEAVACLEAATIAVIS